MCENCETMCLYSKYVRLDIFITNKRFSFFRNVFGSKTVKISYYVLRFEWRSIQSVPISAYSSRFITYAPNLILSGRLSWE